MLGRFIIFTILLSSLLFCYLAVGCDLDGENHGDGPLTPKDQDDDDEEQNCVDKDLDGWCEDEDCNEFNKAVHPGALENCFDQIDNDCDFQVDQDDSDCPDPGDDDFA